MSRKVPLTFLAVVVSALLLVLAIGAVLSSLDEPEDSFIELMGESATPEELVAETVREVRAVTEFPQQYSDYETWVGVEGRGRVLTYQFIADNLENLHLDTEYMKNMMVSGLCEDEEMRYMLREGVEVVYAYTTTDTSQTFSVSLTDRDCE